MEVKAHAHISFSPCLPEVMAPAFTILQDALGPDQIDMAAAKERGWLYFYSPTGFHPVDRIRISEVVDQLKKLAVEHKTYLSVQVYFEDETIRSIIIEEDHREDAEKKKIYVDTQQLLGRTDIIEYDHLINVLKLAVNDDDHHPLHPYRLMRMTYDMQFTGPATLFIGLKAFDGVEYTKDYEHIYGWFEALCFLKREGLLEADNLVIVRDSQ